MGFELNEEWDAVIKYYSIKVKEVKGEKGLAMDKSITLPMHADDLEMVKANKPAIIAYIEGKKAYDSWYHEFHNIFEDHEGGDCNE